MENKNYELRCPLDQDVKEDLRSQVWHKIRTSSQRHANPPWPSLAHNWEKGLREKSNQEIEQKSKIIAKGIANSKINEKRPHDYIIADQCSELLKRISGNQVFLEGTILPMNSFSNSIIPGLNLRNSDFSNCNFSNSFINHVNFEGAKLNDVDFTNCNLENVDFSNTNLRDAIFTGATISNSIFKNADLRNVKDLEYDGNYTFQTLVSPKSKDKWSILNRAYTNIKLFINLLIFIYFITPVFLKLVGLYSLGQIEQTLEKSKLVKIATDSAPKSDIYWELTEGKLYIYNLKDDSLGYVLLSNINLGLWEYLLLTLVVYNISRSWLTFAIAPLKEEYIRSSYTPEKEIIKRLWKVHRFNSYLSWLVYIPMIYFLYEILSTRLYLPFEWVK